jgi:L-aminopeptidase/D-esterase-like protein
MGNNDAVHFSSIEGLRVGHAEDMEALTGVTVVLCEDGATGGVDQRGGAPGTRETDALHMLHLVQQVHAVVLAGGSAFGLEAAGGVVRYLEERNVGLDVGVARVPIVPAAILFDLGLGRADIRPNAEMGYQACLNAMGESGSHPPAEGNVGAGAGATVGKVLGMGQAMKSGMGSAAIRLGGGIIVGAIVAVNVFGDIVDPSTGQIVAGARNPDPSQGIFANTMEVLKPLAGMGRLGFTTPQDTVIGVVATNARLTKEGTNKMAQMAHDGLARTVRPAHTMLDGDTIFALATGAIKASGSTSSPAAGSPDSGYADVNIIGAYAAEAFAQAILRSVYTASPAGGLPSIGGS